MDLTIRLDPTKDAAAYDQSQRIFISIAFTKQIAHSIAQVSQSRLIRANNPKKHIFFARRQLTNVESCQIGRGFLEDR